MPDWNLFRDVLEVPDFGLALCKHDYSNTELYCGRISRAMNTLGKLARVNIGLSRNFVRVENCINNSKSIIFIQIQN